MADYRSVQTRMWREDEWFDELEDNDARIFWVYLFTNPSSSPAGIYRLTMRTMAHEAHVSYDKACELMERFAADKKAYYSGGVVWVVNMRRLQFPDLDGSGAWQVATKMQSDIDAIPDTNPLKGEYLRRNGYPIITLETVNGKEVKRVLIQYGYPIDTQSVNSNSNVTETVTVTVTKPPTRTPPRVDQPALPSDPEFGNAIAALQTLGPVAGTSQMEFNDLWPDLTNGRRGWVQDAVDVAIAMDKRSVAYAVRVLSNAIRDNKRPGSVPERTTRQAPQGRNIKKLLGLEDDDGISPFSAKPA